MARPDSAQGTPAEVVSKLSTGLQKTLKDQALRDRLAAQGSIVLDGSAKEYADYMKAEGERWTKVIKETAAKAA